MNHINLIFLNVTRSKREMNIYPLDSWDNISDLAVVQYSTCLSFLFYYCLKKLCDIRTASLTLSWCFKVSSAFPLLSCGDKTFQNLAGTHLSNLLIFYHLTWTQWSSILTFPLYSWASFTFRPCMRSSFYMEPLVLPAFILFHYPNENSIFPGETLPWPASSRSAPLVNGFPGTM